MMNIHEFPKLYEATDDEAVDPYLFISYSHEDKSIVYEDLKILFGNGAHFWYDKAMHSGESWKEQAKKRILEDENCLGVIFYVSENSLKSPAFLEELIYAEQRLQADKNFSYRSVNIGACTAFEILKRIDVEEDVFLKFLNAFNKDKIFIPRSRDPLNMDHIFDMIEAFEKANSIDISRCSINKMDLFDFVEYERGLQIVNYRGSDAIVNIPSLNNGKKTVAIGINAFKNKTTVRRIIVPEGVQIIDDFAFSGCVNLESVILPHSLISLGYETFRDCCSLEEIVIPYNVESIGDYCFYKCHRINNITILSSAPLKIGFAAFSECHALEDLTLPESLHEIGPYAFNNCINMRKLTIPTRIEKIGLSAFYNCSSLLSIAFETRKLFDNNRWFSRCIRLKEISFPIDNMDDYLMSESWESHRDKLLFKLDSPSNITFSEGFLVWDCVNNADYYVIRINDVQYESKELKFEVPQLKNVSKLFISVQACSNDNRILPSDPSPEIQIKTTSDVYEIISDKDDKILLFYNGDMENVKIPEGVTVIGENAFYNCEEIREVVFPSTVKRIEAKAFYHCVNLKRISFSEGLCEIGDEAFWGAEIDKLILPSTLRRIGRGCFACCDSLIELDLKCSQFSAADKAFYRCISLERVKLPDELTILPDGFFRGCTELDNLVLPEKLEIIKTGSISYVTRLMHINIPKSVRTIEEQAFSYSFGLTDIFVDPENPHYYDVDGVLFSKEGNRLVHYPADKMLREYSTGDCVSTICNYAFMDAEHLESINIGSSVYEIGISAFERCPSLKEVVISGETDRIRANAFKECINLDRLYILSGLVPKIEDGVFDNVGDDFKIYVPKKYINNYLRMVEWLEYRHILYPIE